MGTALLSKSGKIYTGCNVENSSFSLSTCAERTAVVKAVSEGEKEFNKIAVCGLKEGQFVSPCGSCRQVLNEFAQSSHMEVYLVKPSQTEVLKTNLKYLLPLAFNL